MNEDLKKVHSAITELWKLYKEYAEKRANGHFTSEDYDRVISVTKEIWNASDGDRYINDLICVTVSAIERMDV